MDFGLDSETGDIIVKGGLTLVSGSEEIAQRIKVGLTINLGEFFTHVNYGLPWLRNSELDTSDIKYFLGDDNTTTAYIANQIDKYVLSIDQVTSVTSTYSFDTKTRTMTYRPLITGEDGDEIDFPAYTLDI